MEDHHHTDDDWAVVRDAVPSFAAAWAAFVADGSYDPSLPYCNVHEFTRHVVENVVRQRPEELAALADVLEVELTKAMLRDDEDYAGFLTVGVLEGLIEAADECGMPLTRLVPLLRGARTRRHWEEAIAWKRPGRLWDDRTGDQPTIALPTPIATVEIHRGRWLSENRYAVDVTLIGGRVDGAAVIRRHSGKHFWLEWRIVEMHPRSPETPGEYELVLSHRVIDDDYEWDIWKLLLADDDERYWQLATDFAMPRPVPPYDD